MGSRALRPGSSSAPARDGHAQHGSRAGHGGQDADAPAQELRARFGRHADEVLGARAVLSDEAGGRAMNRRFRSAAVAESDDESTIDRRDRAVFPRDAQDAIAIRAEGRTPIFVREQGVEGSLATVEGTLSYARQGGRVFWTTNETGYEEWLSLEAGRAVAGREAARWNVEGRTLRMHDDGRVLVVDEHDLPSIVVSAEVAYTRSGRRVEPRLRIDGGAIVLEVDAGGEEVLIDPSWTMGGNLNTPRADFVTETAVVLGNGKVLLAGGNASGNSAVAEIYDPGTNLWTNTNSMAFVRTRHVGIALATGNAMICGGLTTPTATIPNCEIYNQSTNQWTATGSFQTARGYQAMVRLSDNRILAAGGNTDGTIQASAEIYNPVSGTWSPAGSMTAGRSGARAILLNNGNVAVLGGNDANATYPKSVEVYNPGTNSWAAAGSLAQLANGHSRGGAAKLNDGRILVAGGTPGGSTFLLTAEICSADASSCNPTAPMTQIRQNFHAATIFAGGRVLAAGGVPDTLSTTTLSATEIYNGTTNTWAAGPAMTTPRNRYAMAVLQNGKVLVAGGTSTSGTTGTSEVFSTTACGDGTVDAGEQCDDGNTNAGDCCSPSCTYESTATVCRAAAAGGCDVADTCNGAGACGADAKQMNGFACSDGNACTQSDTCQAGVCTGTNPVTCTASDQCHVAGTCNTTTGICSNPNKADGSTCSDTNPCTQTDTCQAGVCNGTNPVTCTASDQCHVAGTCNTTTGICSNPNKANGSTCNDSNACTLSDSCQTGICTGAAITCTASDQCHVAGTCNTTTGICSNPNKANGSACSDDNACTQSDTCQAGVCNGTNPVTCGASDQCHGVGVCNTVTGTCSNPALPNGSFCNDLNACTQIDSCQSGTCTGGSPVVCTASDQCHVAGTCNTSSGVCSNPIATNGTLCNDNDPCTQTDQCGAGNCIGGNPVVCTASDSCHSAGSCSPVTGTCSNPAKPDGASCSDNDACTQSDTCQAGSCTGANPVSCPTPDQCHVVGTCIPATGQCTTPNKTDGAACVDGNACTQTDVCQAGTCTGSNPIVCSASDQCHDVGVCDPSNGSCTDPAKANGAPCSDGDLCTDSESCQAGTCTGATPVVCTPMDACHLAGVCEPGTGTCSNPPVVGDATCDGFDDDCDGTDDEDYVGVPSTCGVGACAATGTTSCANGAIVDSCTPGTPAADDTTCDGIDDDCNGTADEDGACGAVDAGADDGGAIDDASIGPDDAGEDGAVPSDDGGPDAGPIVPPAGGCGCSTVGSTQRAPGIAGLGLAMMLALVRVRRRRA